MSASMPFLEPRPISHFLFPNQAKIKTNHQHRYFASYFHTFDATVIFAGFIVDVLLHGVLEEVASLVIVLRLWRFFKIVEEFSVGAQEQMDGLELRIEALELENQELKTKLTASKSQDGYDEEAQVGGHRST